MASDFTIVAGVTYEVAVCVTKQTDPTVAAVPDVARGDVEVMLSLSDGGAQIAGLPRSFHATDSSQTMTDPFDKSITGQKYLATINGSDTATPLAGLAAKGTSVFRYATVAGEPVGKSVRLQVVPSAL